MYAFALRSLFFHLQVARRTFVKALAERGSVVMVPGGQAELVHTWRLFQNKQFVICAHHKGMSEKAIRSWVSF
jgi:hypothetical protein